MDKEADLREAIESALLNAATANAELIASMQKVLSALRHPSEFSGDGELIREQPNHAGQIPDDSDVEVLKGQKAKSSDKFSTEMKARDRDSTTRASRRLRQVA